MKKSNVPLIPAKPPGANGLKPPAREETMTLNLDQVELQTTKAVQKGMEAMRMVITALQNRIAELEVEVAKLKPAEGAQA